eukprot:TRINITY_DN8088_c0_g1_i1.p1 TRINITY_DN8088_c0_g1~~TRINITY_DN8088_c0_g1_i1.p1  ORF type:complete len:182 (+),score=37.75 TRINITY_DN8088_c0_g1_i1:133-678(+)
MTDDSFFTGIARGVSTNTYEDSEKKILTATQLKEEGNTYFKNQDYKNAARKYNIVINAYLKGLHPLNSDQQERVKSLNLICYSNLAIVQEKLGLFDKAIAACKECLAVDPNYVKVLFRRGKLLSQRGDLDSAKEDLRKAAQLAPNDTGIREELRILKLRFQAFREQEKKKLQEGFSKMVVS